MLENIPDMLLVMLCEYVHTGQVKISLGCSRNLTCDLWFATVHIMNIIKQTDIKGTILKWQNIKLAHQRLIPSTLKHIFRLPVLADHGLLHPRTVVFLKMCGVGLLYSKWKTSDFRWKPCINLIVNLTKFT